MKEHLRVSLTSVREPSETIGEQPAIVVRFNFSDNREEPFSNDEVAAALSGADGFYRANSYGAAWFSAPAVTPWIPSELPAESGGNLGYWGWLNSLNLLAQAAGFDVSQFNRQIYLFPQNPFVGFVGASTVGEPPVFLNGTLDAHVLAHELGHTFGLYHSHGGYWDGTDRWGEEYGDIFDTMGSGRGHFNAFQKERLGWIGGKGKNIRTIVKSGNYRVAPIDAAGGNPKALFWRSPAKSFGHAGYGVWIELRSEGIVIHQGGEISYGGPLTDDSTLLDLSPGPETKYVLNPGERIAFEGIEIVGVDSDSVQVTVP